MMIIIIIIIIKRRRPKAPIHTHAASEREMSQKNSVGCVPPPSLHPPHPSLSILQCLRCHHIRGARRGEKMVAQHTLLLFNQASSYFFSRLQCSGALAKFAGFIRFKKIKNSAFRPFPSLSDLLPYNYSRHLDICG